MSHDYSANNSSEIDPANSSDSSQGSLGTSFAAKNFERDLLRGDKVRAVAVQKYFEKSKKNACQHGFLL